MKLSIIVVCGPTATGKTGFAIHLANRFNGEIIGADSMQVFRHLDIGTAKPDQQELSQAPHHMVSVVDPWEDFDAARYAAMADAAIKDVVSRNKIPIIAGGTGLYIKALLHGLFRGRPADPAIVSYFESIARDRGNEFLHRLLEKRDPVAAARLHPNDRFRIIRALEVLETTGDSITRLQTGHGFASSRYRCLKLGLYMDRQTLYQRIEKRVDLMIQQGLLDEVRGLIDRGITCDLKAMKSIGYRHMCEFLQNRVSWEESLVLLKRDTRRYAKRQFTWFNSDPEIEWIEPNQTETASLLVQRFFQNSTPGINQCLNEPR